jgi:hypothetical protein
MRASRRTSQFMYYKIHHRTSPPHLGRSIPRPCPSMQAYEYNEEAGGKGGFAYRDTNLFVVPPFLITPNPSSNHQYYLLAYGAHFLLPTQPTSPHPPLSSRLQVVPTGQPFDKSVHRCTILRYRQDIQLQNYIGLFLIPLGHSRKLRISFEYPGRHLAGRINHQHSSLFAPLLPYHSTSQRSQFSFIWRTLTSIQTVRKNTSDEVDAAAGQVVSLNTTLLT